jgi:hypothetical protein
VLARTFFCLCVCHGSSWPPLRWPLISLHFSSVPFSGFCPLRICPALVYSLSLSRRRRCTSQDLPSIATIRFISPPLLISPARSPSSVRYKIQTAIRCLFANRSLCGSLIPLGRCLLPRVPQRSLMADVKQTAFARGSAAARAAEALCQYLPSELAHMTGEYLRVPCGQRGPSHESSAPTDRQTD